MSDACYALLAATTSGNNPQILEPPAIDGTIQAVNELDLYVCAKPNPLNWSLP